MLVLAVALIAPFVLDLNNYKGYIAELVKQQTGRELAIDGDIDLSLLPIPTVRVSGVRFANPAGAETPDMLRIAMVEASIALAPLFGGSVEINSLTFVDPVITLERYADGSANWQLALAGGGAGRADNGTAAAVRIDSLKVENATLIYRDDAQGTLQRIEQLHMEAAMGSIEGPFSAVGRLVAQSGEAKAVALGFTVDIGRLDRSPLPLSATFTLDDADATVKFTGSASSATSDAEISGKLKLEGASLARILAVLGSELSNPLLDQSFSASATLSATTAAAGINDILFEFGGVQGSGAISATLGQAPQIDVAVALSQIDLDALLARAAGTGDMRAEPSSAAAPFALPDGLYATLDLRINALTFNNSVVRQVQLVAALDQGVVTLQQASALLPGGSDVTIFGVLDSQDNRPHFTGQIEASAGNLRAVLDWLDIAYPAIPADRLRQLSLSTKIELTPNLAKISAIDLRVDLSRLTGGVNVGIGARPAFNAIITLDKINLDAYLPIAAADTASEAAQADSDPLALLDHFDAEIKVTIGSLVYNNSTLSGITLDAGVRGGTLNLRSLVVSDMAGAGVTIAGTVDSSKLDFDLTYAVETGDAARLFRLAELPPPSPDFGALAITGRVSGTLSSVTLDSRISLSDAEAHLTGVLTGLDGAPRIDGEISLETGSLSRLARRFGVSLPATADNPLSLSGTVKGDMAEAKVNLTLAALGADVRLDGRLNNLLAAPSYDLTLAVSHPDFASLVESLAKGVRFARRDLGEVRLRATLTGNGDRLRIEGIDALLGPSQIAGVITGRFDGPRPQFEADLTTGAFVADMFLDTVAGTGGGGEGGGGATQTAGTAAPETAERWSREPIDLAGLRGFDLNARIASQALAFRKYLFEDVTLRLKLVEGVLDVEELSGRLYGAPTTVRARLTASTPPTLSLSFSLQGADLRALMMDAAAIEEVSGRLDLTGQFSSRGRSEFEMVSALQGEATLAVRNGAIEGIDLGQLNSRLANINSEIDLIALIGGALNGGTTAIISIDGQLLARDGVLRGDNIRAVLEGGEGRATVSIDLPRWQLALNSEFRLTGHPKAPPVGLLLMGPIDDPVREIRDQALRDYITAKIIGVGVRKLLSPAITGNEIIGGTLGGVLDVLTGGGLTPQPASPPDDSPPAGELPPPEPLQPNPQQLFQNLLEGLIQGN